MGSGGLKSHFAATTNAGGRESMLDVRSRIVTREHCGCDENSGMSTAVSRLADAGL